ncbi:MSHA biogenesis protein MshK [Gammaproteobacteria bacterium]
MKSLSVSSTLLTFGMLLGYAACEENLPDPTRPAFTTAINVVEEAPVTNDSLALQSILIGSHDRWAIINGQIVKVGDSVSGTRLIRIEGDEVILARGDEREILKLFPNLDRNSLSGRKN